jgi:hypothetical protein
MVRIHPDPPVPKAAAWQQAAVRQDRGCSSIGRAPALQAGGRRFDPVQLHQVEGAAGRVLRLGSIGCGARESALKRWSWKRPRPGLKCCSVL